MIKVLIVEDEEAACKRLTKLLEEISSEIVIEKTIDTVVGAIEFLKSESNIDLIFLDIQLADGLSFEIFGEVKVTVPIIFTTAYNQYALKAFELNSIDYLLKPIDKEKLKKSLNKFNEIKEHYSSDIINNQVQAIFENFRNQESTFKSRFLIPKGDELVPIDINEIAFFYAEDKAVFLVGNKGERFIINFSLDQLEQNLDPLKFYRINRHQVISRDNIGKIYNYFNYRLKLDLKIDLEQEFIVSKAKVSDFKNWLS